MDADRQPMRWMREKWREPSTDSGDTSVTTLVSFVNSNLLPPFLFTEKRLNTDSCACVVVSNSCQHSHLIFFGIDSHRTCFAERSAATQAFAGNTFYRLLSLPLTSVLMNSYVNALVFVRRIARRGKFLHNPRHMSPTSSSCCVCELHINHGCAFTVHFLLTDGGRRR